MVGCGVCHDEGGSIHEWKTLRQWHAQRGGCQRVTAKSTCARETRDVLARAKPRLHLINIGRGALIDHDALLAAVERDALGRATLDVTEPEPLGNSGWQP